MSRSFVRRLRVMMRASCTVGAVRVASLVFGATSCSIALAQSTGIDVPSAQWLLERMRASQAGPRNLQYTVEYHDQDKSTPADRDLQLRMYRERFENRGLPEAEISRRLEQQRQSLEMQDRHQTDRMMSDAAGRARVETALGHYDAAGHLIPSPEKSVTVWDGTTSITYNERENLPPSAILGDQRPFNTTDRYRQPLRQFGGNLADALADALEKDVPIEIERQEDSTYRISFPRGSGREVAVIDPEQGYLPTLQEFYRNGILRDRYTAEFRQIDGVWLPVRGAATRFHPTTPGKVMKETEIEVTAIEVNVPEERFEKELLALEFPDGTRVLDARTGAEYFVGDDMSLTVRRLAGPETLGQMLNENLEEALATPPLVSSGRIEARDEPVRAPDQMPATVAHASPSDHEGGTLVYVLVAAAAVILVVVLAAKALRRRQQRRRDLREV